MEDAKSATEMPSPNPPWSPSSLIKLGPRWDEGVRANESTERDDTVDRIFLPHQSSDGAPLSRQHDGNRVRKEGSVAEDASFSFYETPKCTISSEEELATPLDGLLTPTPIQIIEPVRVIPVEHHSGCEDAAEEKEIPFTFNALTVDSASNVKSIEVDEHRADSLHVDVARKYTVEVVEPTTNPVKLMDERGLIDTAAPIESVKEAVSKFGGILDWKAHKVQALERRKFVEEELEKTLEEIPEYKRRSEKAEEEKLQVLKDLDSAKRQIEDLKLNVERAQTEEYQARQDSDLAKLRMEEIEQGIEDEASYATRAQLEVAKARYSAAVSEFSMVNDELEALHEKYISLVEDKISAMEKAEEAIAASREAEKMVEELSIELIGAKEALESAQAAHLEAEEQRIGAAMAKEQECLNWEKDLGQVEEELLKLNEQIEPVKELKLKLETASTLLRDLKAELAEYMESAVKREQEEGNDLKDEAQASSLKNEMETVKSNLEKTTAEVNCLKVAADSLEAELQAERTAIVAVKESEELASLTVKSLKAELDRIKSEIYLSQEKEYENQENMVVLPKQLTQGAQEVDRAASHAEQARQELSRAKEQAEQAKERASTVQSQLESVLKKIEAAKASEKLALEAIKALEDSESTEISSDADTTHRIKLSLEEYYELSRKAREAEEQANMRVAEAVLQIEAAKESECQCLEKLEQVNQEKVRRKEELRYAMEKAEKSQASKLEIEQELRKWRSEHEQKRKEGGNAHGSENPGQSYEEMKESSYFIRIPEHPTGYPAMPSSSETEPYSEEKHAKKKKKSFFPRLLLFLARRKAHRHS